jgi:hypothetical protein
MLSSIYQQIQRGICKWRLSTRARPVFGLKPFMSSLINSSLIQVKTAHATSKGDVEGDLISFRGNDALISGTNAAIVAIKPTPSRTASFARSFR